MSRSYKKHPVYTDGKRKSTKENKRIANSAIRSIRCEDVRSEVLAGKSNRFKKIAVNTYDIHDYVTRETENEARERFEHESFEYSSGKLRHYSLHYEYGTVDNYINKRWAKYFKRK